MISKKTTVPARGRVRFTCTAAKNQIVSNILPSNTIVLQNYTDPIDSKTIWDGFVFKSRSWFGDSKCLYNLVQSFCTI